MLPTPADPSSTVPSQTRSSASRVLVVDDERAVRELFRRILLFEGFDVVVASGGAEGLRLLATDPRIGLVLLDLDMPVIDGRAFRAAQCGDPRLACIPTVVVTGTVLTEAICLELNAADYLRKPVAREDFVRVVERYCERIGDAALPEWTGDK